MVDSSRGRRSRLVLTPVQQHRMPDFLFSALALTRGAERVEIRYPGGIWPYARAKAVAERHGLDVRADAAGWRLTYHGPDTASPVALKAYFAELNGCPRPYPRPDTAVAGSRPVVSCIVLVNENGLFVREQLLPSLFANSHGTPLEVVLVHNGSGPPWSYPGCVSTAAPWGAVAASYNAGARLARGEYLAFFHDDCVVDDPQWIARCRAALDEGAAAAAAEYRQMPAVEGVTLPGLLVAKCVPLFMRRETFRASGGYDEFHYVGYEDLDFTLALLERGLRLSAVSLAVRHYGGMSSTLKYCPVPGLGELYAMTAVPAGAIRQAFREYTHARAAADPSDLMLLALDVQKLYVLKKYRRLLARLDAPAHARAVAALERRITSRASCDPHLILPRFREEDRAAAAAAGAA